jgi:tryptophan synthase alpha chain
MVSYAIIFRTGPQEFVRQASEAGFSGFIVPDLPADEAGEFADIVKSHGLDLIQLIAPTTTPERAERTLQTASGFLYCISVAGITGERDRLPDELLKQLQWLKSRTSLPLAVGFGISRPEHIDALRGHADGAIVGSAFVRQIAALSEGKVSQAEMLERCGTLAGEMVAATRRGPSGTP